MAETSARRILQKSSATIILLDLKTRVEIS